MTEYQITALKAALDQRRHAATGSCCEDGIRAIPMIEGLCATLLPRLPLLARDALPLDAEMLALVADPEASDRAPGRAAVATLLERGVLQQDDGGICEGALYLNYIAHERLSVARPFAADREAVDRALLRWVAEIIDAGPVAAAPLTVALNQLSTACDERKRPPSPLSVRLWLRYGQFHERCDYPHEAQYAYETAERLCVTTREHALRAYAIGRQAALAEQQGAAHAAAPLYDRARRAARSRLAQRLLARTLSDPGHLAMHQMVVVGTLLAETGAWYIWSQELHAMERRAREFLSDAGVRGDLAAQADALHLLAGAHALCGDRAALTVLHQAIAASAAASGETSVRTATHRAALGTLLIEAGERSAAQDQLTRAHAAFEHHAATASTAHVMVLNALAGLARASGDYRAASAWLGTALAHSEHPGVVPAVATTTRHNQASLALATAMRLS